jgi:hypothetical protein
MQAYIAIGALVLAICFQTWLTYYNLKQIIADKEQRLEARRKQRKARKSPWVWPT